MKDFINEITPLITFVMGITNQTSIEEILKERDKYEVISPEWNILNSLKAMKLEKEKPSTKEVIIAFKESDLSNIPEGISTESRTEELGYIEIRRSEAEYHPLYRHPIPYVIVKHKDKYFFILREKGSGEARLIGKKGMLGGHVSIEDSNETKDLYYTILKSMERELEEEAGITADIVKEVSFIATLKSNEGVDADHLGLIFLVELNTDKIKSEEEDILTGIWIKEKDLDKHANQFESWSKIIYENILRK